MNSSLDPESGDISNQSLKGSSNSSSKFGFNFSCLPGTKTFRQLLPAYLLPYAAYVLLGTLLPSFLHPTFAQFAKLLLCTGLLWFFRNQYKLPTFKGQLLVKALLYSFPALLLWVFPLLLQQNFSVILEVLIQKDYQQLQFISAFLHSEAFNSDFCLHLINSVFLVALFEELLIRVYCLELFHQGFTKKSIGASFTNLGLTMDTRPQILNQIPWNIRIVTLCAFIFAAGHPISQWPSALLYFAFTQWIYSRFKNIWICILIHSFVNLWVAIMAGPFGWTFLWDA